MSEQIVLTKEEAKVFYAFKNQEGVKKLQKEIEKANKVISRKQKEIDEINEIITKLENGELKYEEWKAEQEALKEKRKAEREAKKQNNQ